MAAGDILFATVRPYLKKIGYATPALDGEIASTGFCVLRPVETVDSRYVYHYVQCDIFLNQILPKQRGVSYPAILDSDIFDSSIPLPPLAEQRRIVAALEDHLSRLDAGQSYVRQVTYQATKFSSSYLLGLLRETSRCSWSKLGDLAHDSCYGTSEKCSYDGNGIPVIRIPNVQSGQIELSDLKYTLQADLHLNNLMIRRGDILFIRSNGSRSLIGRAAVAKTNLDAAFASYLIRFRLNPELVNPQWVNAVVQSPPLRAEIESLAASSAGQYNLNISKLARLKIPVPSPQMQEDLLNQFDEASESASRLNRFALQLDSRAAQLRRSLLSEAFAGCLVPQDPNDEPASVLLEGIRTERIMHTKPKRIRRAAQPTQEPLL